jgi:hypothetical protein
MNIEMERLPGVMLLKFGMVGGEDFGKKLSDLDYTRFHNVIVGSEVF